MSDPRDRLDVDTDEVTEKKTSSDESDEQSSLDVIGLDDSRPWLSPEQPGGGPNEVVDPRAQAAPGGFDVERNLADLDDGIGRGIPGSPNHHGIGSTYDQDDRVDDDAFDPDNLDVLDPAKPQSGPPPPDGGSSASGGQTIGEPPDGGSSTSGGTIGGGNAGGPPPGVELGARAPKWDQVGQDGGTRQNSTAAQLAGLVGGGGQETKGPTAKEQIEAIKNEVEKAGGKPEPTPVLKPYDPKKTVDPDADTGGVAVAPTAEEVERAVVAGGGDPINPDDWQAPEIEGDPGARDPYSPYANPNPDGDPTGDAGGSGAGTPPPPGGGYTDPGRPDLDVPVITGPPPAGGGGPTGTPEGSGTEAAAPAPTVVVDEPTLAPTEPAFDGDMPDDGAGFDPDGDGFPG